MIPRDSIDIRKYRTDIDKAFVYSTWLRNYKHSSYFAKRIRSSTFFSGHQDMLHALFQRQTVKALVACPKEDHETILGYLVFEDHEKPTVHFTFVKDTFRKMGIARALFEAAGLDPNTIIFTQWTYPVDEFIRRFDGMNYDPYKL